MWRAAEPGRVAKAVLVDAVPPVMVKKDSNPGGTPIEVFDGFRAALAANRAQFYLDIPSGPFYGFNRPGAKVSEGLIRNWWRQGMMGSVKAGYECIKAFSETDFTEDLKAIDVPVLVIHSEDDQIVPYADSAPLTVKLLKNGTLKTYKDLPHGLLPDPSRDRKSGDTCLHSRAGNEGRPASGRMNFGCGPGQAAGPAQSAHTSAIEKIRAARPRSQSRVLVCRVPS